MAVKHLVRPGPRILRLIHAAIASPQNLIALEYMDMPVSWLQWFAIALPVSFSSVVLIFALLCLFYSWDKSTRINPVRPTKDPFSATQTWVSIVCLGTIALWLFAQSLGPWLVRSQAAELS